MIVTLFTACRARVLRNLDLALRLQEKEFDVKTSLRQAPTRRENAEVNALQLLAASFDGCITLK